MKVWGVTPGQIGAAADRLGLTLEYSPTREGLAWRFRPLPVSAFGKYARRSPDNGWRKGRRLRACCYHGFRDLIKALFAAGATRVQSTQGDWRAAHRFNADLGRLRRINVGSRMYPAEMQELCDCEKDGGRSDG